MSIDQIGQKPAYSVYEERDTYRDLCVELLESLETLHERAGSQSSLTDELIEKAKKTLGENNAT